MALFTQILLVVTCVIIAECTLPLRHHMMGAGLHMGGGMMGPGIGVGVGAGYGPYMTGPGMMGPGMMGGGMMAPGMMGGMMYPGLMGYKDQDETPETIDEALHRPTDKLPDEVANAVQDSKLIQLIKSRPNP
ncbi:27 kDa primary mesenchyme-specific spicule protein-like isoform X2 [Pectinophora gossypiella]|uniref:27 kDa primary mesenchyme-specific spicule protein-like isoform X2 n=1 Tax=Pectinophora gossypiella TaxID=13191 RepID=UPI00214E3D1B|nr:27 kDa primary mesenchyme-specific spicule protein-like isoform X2 [Pectinophora gossypiella]